MIKKRDLTTAVKNLCMKWKVSRYSSDKYDGSVEWIERRLLEYAVICRDINKEEGLNQNAMHAYTLIHELWDPNDREKIRYFYDFYKTARRLAKSTGLRFG